MARDMETLFKWKRKPAPFAPPRATLAQRAELVTQFCRHRMAKVRWKPELHRCRGCGQEMDGAMMAARAKAKRKEWDDTHTFPRPKPGNCPP